MLVSFVSTAMHSYLDKQAAYFQLRDFRIRGGLALMTFSDLGFGLSNLLASCVECFARAARHRDCGVRRNMRWDCGIKSEGYFVATVFYVR